jgi:outer membrane protein
MNLMKRGKLWSFAGGFVLLAGALPLHAADLLSVYDRALQNDPQIREADATRLAQREARPQAVGPMLPQISASAGRTRNQNDINGSEWNSSGTWSLSLRQSIFSWANIVALRTSSDQVAQAEANFLVQQQSLAQRVAQLYFAVLQAQDNLRAQEAARDALSKQLDQAEQRFEVGLIPVTDVQEARAARDTSAAQVISAKRSLASAEEQLRAVIAERPVALNEPGADMPLLSPDPASEDAWVKQSLDQNASLMASRLAAEIARDNVDSAFSGHLPSVDLSASQSHSTVTDNSKSISLQLSVPLFSGGTTSSRVRQSQYQWIAAKERLERTSRDTERQARDAYQAVNSDIARVNALRVALESSRTALASTELGAEVGTRTTIDVLNSRQQLIQAETNYSAAKYSYLNNLIALRLAAGDLDRRTLEEVNRLLTVAPTPAP